MTNRTHGNDRVPEFSLGERIRKVREDLDLSQQQFAVLLGVDRKTIGHWEGGRHVPRYRDLMMISSAADVSLEWLAGDLFQPSRVPVGFADTSRGSSRTNGEYSSLVAA